MDMVQVFTAQLAMMAFFALLPIFGMVRARRD